MAMDASWRHCVTSQTPDVVGRVKRGATRRSLTLAVLAVAVGLFGLVSSARAFGDPETTAKKQAFREGIDLSQMRLIAVQNDGRIKTFDSLAREMFKAIDASGKLAGKDAVYAYLDMMFNGGMYQDLDIIYIKKQAFRNQFVGRLKTASERGSMLTPISDEQLSSIARTGYVSPAFLDRNDVRSILADLDRDVMRTAKEVNKLESARNLSDPALLENLMAVIPFPGATMQDRWSTARALSGIATAVQAHAGMEAAALDTPLPGLDADTTHKLSDAWGQVRNAWVAMDAPRANAAMDTFASILGGIEPKAYPSETKRGLEIWYYSSYKMTWVWIPYLLAVAVLVIGVVYRWKTALNIGLGIFLVSFAMHTVSIGIRWYLAGRIPNSNMFEAIIASAWFGALVAIVIEVLVRKSTLRGIPALGGAVCGMFANMAGFYMPIKLDSSIQTPMPILNTVWLYIHTNLIIASYALITIAATSAALYLIIRGLRALVPARGLVALWEGNASGGGGAALAAPGGAEALILSGTSKGANLFDEERSGMSTVLDAVTMIFMELSFITLWTGIVLGAMWADLSWGRPWGWDPKEVFALNTWLIFLILVHVRLKVRDKALWTAILAVIGFAVMMFNWIAVNFVIVGLHSYA